MKNAAFERWLQTIGAAVVLVAMVALSGGAAAAGTIDKIRADQTIRLAYRDDARPFSYKSEGAAEPSGYMVDLCRAVAKKLADQLGIPSLKVAYVPVTAANRFETIQNHNADLLCEPTSETLSRRDVVDFSIATFVDGAGIMTNDKEHLHEFVGLTGRKIGVLTGTTTEETLRNMLKGQGIPAEIVPAKTHEEGLAMLDDGRVSAYFADRSILVYLLKASKAPDKLAIADAYLTMEPYALALARGDDDFRTAVDTALSHIYRSGEIIPVYNQTFTGTPTDTVRALYLLSGLPD
jgi:polar amino acid transport system substrate-binding protein/glutamate/aspartate transport system substrate-binding protein